MSNRRHGCRARTELCAALAACFALAALLTACGDGDGTGLTTHPEPDAPATTLAPGTKELKLDNLRGPVEVKYWSDSNWRFAFEVTRAETAVHGRYGIAEPGKAYVKVYLRTKNLATDRPAPFDDDAVGYIFVAKRPGPGERCTDSELLSGGFCRNLDVGLPYEKRREDPSDESLYYLINNQWTEAYYAEGGQIPPGGYGQMLVEVGPFAEPLEGRDFLVWTRAQGASETRLPLAGG